MGFLTGKTVILTGGGRAVLENGGCGSIGYGIATAYAKEGANLVITGRNVLRKNWNGSTTSRCCPFRRTFPQGRTMKPSPARLLKPPWTPSAASTC